MIFNKPNNINNAYSKYNDIKLFNNKILKKWNMYEKQFKQFQYLDYNDITSYPDRIINYVMYNINIDINTQNNVLYEFQIINDANSIFTDNFNNTKIINIINKSLYKYICIYEINNMPELKFCILYYDSKLHNEKNFNYDTDNIIIFFIENEDLKILNSVSESYEFKKPKSINDTYVLNNLDGKLFVFIDYRDNPNRYKKLYDNALNANKYSQTIKYLNTIGTYVKAEHEYEYKKINKNCKLLDALLPNEYKKFNFKCIGYWLLNDGIHIVCSYAPGDFSYSLLKVFKINELNFKLDESNNFIKVNSISSTISYVHRFIDRVKNNNNNLYLKYFDANDIFDELPKYLTWKNILNFDEYTRIFDNFLSSDQKNKRFHTVGIWFKHNFNNIICLYRTDDLNISSRFLFKIINVSDITDIDINNLSESYDFKKPNSINSTYSFSKIKDFINKILDNDNYLKLNNDYHELEKSVFNLLDKYLPYNSYRYFEKNTCSSHEFNLKLSNFLKNYDKHFDFIGWWNIPESDKSICLWESGTFKTLFMIIDNYIINKEIDKNCVHTIQPNTNSFNESYEFKKPTNINNVMDPVKGIEKYIDKLKAINTESNYDYKLLYSINNDYSINLNSMLKIKDPNFEFDENYKIRSAHNLGIMNNKIYTELPNVSPDIISGSFGWINGNLINTKNVPDGGSIFLSNNNISDLSDLPNVIYGKLFLDHNNITNINWNVEKICGDLHLEHNPISIKSLVNNIPIILGDLYIDENIISTLNSNEYKILASHVIGNIEKI